MYSNKRCLKQKQGCRTKVVADVVPCQEVQSVREGSRLKWKNPICSELATKVFVDCLEKEWYSG